MNKRIKELALKARLSYVMTEDNPYIEEDLEKFAELIVKECAKIAYECGPSVVYGSERQFDPITYTGNQILIHFGVE